MIAAGVITVRSLERSASGVWGFVEKQIPNKEELKKYGCDRLDPNSETPSEIECKQKLDALPETDEGLKLGAEVIRTAGGDVRRRTTSNYDVSREVVRIFDSNLTAGSTHAVLGRDERGVRIGNRTLFGADSPYLQVGNSVGGIQIQEGTTALAQVVTAVQPQQQQQGGQGGGSGGGGAGGAGGGGGGGAGTPTAAGQDPIGSIELGLAPSSSETGYKVSLSLRAPVYKTSRGEVGGYGSFISRNDLSISTEPHSIHGTLSAGKPKHREDIHFGLYGNRNFLGGKLVLNGELGILDINDLYDDPGLGPRISVDGEVIPGHLTLSGGLFVGATRAVLIAEDPDISGPGYAVNGGFKLTFFKSAARFVRDSYLSLNATYSDGEPVPEYFTLAPAAAVTLGYQRFTLTPSVSLLGGVDQEGGANIWIPNLKLTAAYAVGGGSLYADLFNWSRVMTRDAVASSGSANVDSATGDAGGADSYAATLGINKSQLRWAAGYRGGAILGGGLKSWAAELNYTRVTLDDYTNVSGGGSGSEPSGKEPKDFAGVTLKGTF